MIACYGNSRTLVRASSHQAGAGDGVERERARDAKNGKRLAQASVTKATEVDSRILAIIKDTYAELRPAERRVADVVLADVTFAVDASNGEIAKRSETSEPTVTRFCRAIGCAGVRDFKLKLAQSTVVGRLYLDVPNARRSSADGSPLWKEIFGEARAALAIVEDTLPPEEL